MESFGCAFCFVFLFGFCFFLEGEYILFICGPLVICGRCGFVGFVDAANKVSRYLPGSPLDGALTYVIITYTCCVISKVIFWKIYFSVSRFPFSYLKNMMVSPTSYHSLYRCLLHGCFTCYYLAQDEKGVTAVSMLSLR